MPACPRPEWAPHEAMWIGWPSHPELWEDDLDPARAEVSALATAIRAGGQGERIILVAANEAAAQSAREVAGCEVVIEPFGDIWLRDTGPIVTHSRAAAFRFNWWGGKYHLPGDETLAPRLAAVAGLTLAQHDWVLEGGAIDGDGTGLVVTTEQCLLNPNRNPGLLKSDIEARLNADLGYDRVLWLGQGLAEDHTDGHVDNLARFVARNRLAIPEGSSADDPNAAVYADAAERARAAGVEVVAIPSPGLVERDGETIPASYMNFLIGNAVVVVPLYGAANDEAAVATIAALFPDRAVMGFRADHILTGGGSFHCISQQWPA